VKDDTNVEQLDTTLGYVKRLYQPAKENAVLVKTLMDLGAVPYCKTNVPQVSFKYIL
jgi:Asp-tRNA(Asn)/Glu-tRNA(Gln) amidotransferase A subunit family amidase